MVWNKEREQAHGNGHTVTVGEITECKYKVYFGNHRVGTQTGLELMPRLEHRVVTIKYDSTRHSARKPK